jgi:hypothetical protein
MQLNTNPNVGQQQGEQTQRMKADIKNILPIDLYEGMMRGSILVAEMSHQDSLDERRIKEFLVVFRTVYKFTRLKINDTLRDQIDEWFKHMTIPLPRLNPAKYGKHGFLKHGLDLYDKFYDELVKLGIGSMFDEPIQPPIGLMSELEDESIWEDAPDE